VINFPGLQAQLSMTLGKFVHKDNKFDWTGSNTKLGVSFALKKAVVAVAL
jgi:hypothetical protein